MLTPKQAMEELNRTKIEIERLNNLLPALARAARPMVNSDDDPTIRAVNDASYRWGQIGGHMRLAMRRSSHSGLSWRELYRGPEATDEECLKAYEDFCASR